MNDKAKEALEPFEDMTADELRHISRKLATYADIYTGDKEARRMSGRCLQVADVLDAATARTSLTSPPKAVEDVGAASDKFAKAIASCEGEQYKFEEWAESERFDMHEHPLHYLFMDPKTNAARQGWKAALRYVEGQLTCPVTVPEGKYLIWSNEHRAWWRPDSDGYTTHVESAGRYERAQAIEIASHARGGWYAGKVPDEIAIAEADVLAHRIQPPRAPKAVQS